MATPLSTTPLGKFMDELAENRPELFDDDNNLALTSAILAGPPEVVEEFLVQIQADILRRESRLN